MNTTNFPPRDQPGDPELPIINCHSHIFTGDHVPPWLARTFLPFPVYYLLPASGVVALLRWWYGEKGPNQFFFGKTWKTITQALYKIRMFLVRNILLRYISPLIGAYLTINVFFFLYHLIAHPGKEPANGAKQIGFVEHFLLSAKIISADPHILLIILYIILMLLFYKWGRDLIIFIFNYFWKFLSVLPSKSTLQLLQRYVLIGRFSRYKTQRGIFTKLHGQYPHGAGFVILPMDMDEMKAGKAKFDINRQMQDLITLKADHGSTCYPFVFADPRKMIDPSYFSYTVDDTGNVILKDCLVKQLLDKGFSGIKIYPALGYYPFDDILIPLWKYAVQKNLPIITHCIKGVIFYRGPKDKDWDKHPVFDDLFLPQRKNVDFTVNFSHPMNFVCLLDEPFLRKRVGRNQTLHRIFGYKNDDTPLDRNLSDLKLCFGHFGGDDQWQKFIDRDRDDYSGALLTHPDHGVDFQGKTRLVNGVPVSGKPEQLWNFCDWYTIICSIMLQYTNTYADISYILHNTGILPLLKQTLQNGRIRDRVLYGTDFYVVRNYKCDKEMLADMMGGLDKDEFDQIARINPRKFLNLK